MVQTTLVVVAVLLAMKLTDSGCFFICLGVAGEAAVLHGTTVTVIVTVTAAVTTGLTICWSTLMSTP